MVPFFPFYLLCLVGRGRIDGLPKVTLKTCGAAGIRAGDVRMIHVHAGAIWGIPWGRRTSVGTGCGAADALQLHPLAHLP